LVTILPPFVADFSSSVLPNTQRILPDSTTIAFKDLSTNATEWLWIFGDGMTSSLQNPTHRYEFSGNYQVTLIAKNAIGCVDTVTKGIYNIVEPQLEIPNVFTPNGDGINDQFVIRYRGTKSYTLVVLDRWGKQLWSSNDPNTHWDGTNNGNPAVEGVYYYVLKIGDKTYNGNITLLR
ncbi:MAG: gliding motility-associated C-terminal domain-containing protein, partial [Bacteroidia bacterium]|nr:gliding motility-associated C-terminal domain-containing protein [Bacteroidia bacterium]